MAKRGAWSLLLIGLLLSGCTGEEAPTTDPASGRDGADPDDDAGVDDPTLDAAPVVVPVWNVTATGCTLLVVTTPLLAGPTRDILPEGFTPIPFSGLPETAGAALVVSRCASAATPDGEVQGHEEVLVYIYVEPPQEYRADGISLYRVIVRHGVADAGLRDGYAAANITVAKARTTATAAPLPAGIRHLDAKATFDDLVFSFSGPAGGTGETDVTLFRLFTLESGEVSGAIDLELQKAGNVAGPGTYVVERGTMFGRPAGPALVLQYDTGDGPGYRITPVTDLMGSEA